MDFTFNDEQRAFRSLLRDFVEKEIKPVAGEWERTGRYPTEIVEQMKEMGLFGMTIDRKSTRLNSSHTDISRMPSSA